VSESLVYRSAAAYRGVMRLLYGRHARTRLSAVAALIPPGSSILELCCGPGMLYREHLRARRTEFLGLDINPRFVEAARRAGARAQVRDVSDEAPLPPADIVVMQASLYHFLPEPEDVIGRMLAAARSQVIVSEPIRNLSSSAVAPLGALARRGADPGDGTGSERFDEASLDAFMGRYRERIERSFVIPGGRDKIFVLVASTTAAGVDGR
jgi:SAM-dependent methyltransferase